MSKNIKIYIAVLVFILILILIGDYNKQKTIDWRPTYSVNDKIPYGLYVFDKEIGGILKNQKIERIPDITPYEFLDSKYNEDTLVETYTVKGTFINISQQNNLDDQSAKEIMYFVSHGNNAFLSMTNFPKTLLDSLKFEYSSNLLQTKDASVWMANKKLSSKIYKSTSDIADYFSKIDTLNTTVLGYEGNPKYKKNINFIKVPYKNGYFFLHTNPVAFTNYNLLKKDRYQYTEKVLSYIPKGDVFWYTKSPNDENISASPLRYIFSQPALKWAWYLFLIGMFVFILFNAKRKQRIVPILQPLSNLTIDFTKTIGNLYYQEGDHKNIIDKKIIYFLERIRTEYLIDTTKLDDEFVKKLQHKTGKDEKDIQELVLLINEYRNSYHGNIEADLIRINNAIEKILH
ncbi:DUF4350 domain-containing protein [Flavobacterium johnsoniae]|uniref:DUF4350 domain-containing protein n=1 Tax=Flavobacterium johnsoniae (strain ATCC 17061 / DSM 2064 / JCM 8514 / BCRC 14874 / CCUG 350202 / NBRC 14942 / NCIMB 11054 / UW101) TaxID=376686 RepID=A5FHQ4_FLAJ1|nr:DUF4350 domain-containing protein [Flavobacterium johnsoniae]ABQ05258.1 hypothetical protein Fjoh_2230 [Flavobacterium johnsoniae UW101]OXE96968.1 hypothetical protein B0A63_20965 [Flavobacterium johnsoniae UW101]WQG82940.1 DUF4350 domain-containing protein [Flavobacterium johnsoniae UW101]SHL62071.1 protein of unknown function [Flavobacterium johnsoniae]